MTGEVTLRGRVLPIGGLKRNCWRPCVAASPPCSSRRRNEKDLADIPANVTEGLKIIPVAHADQVLAEALTQPLIPIDWVRAGRTGRAAGCSSSGRGRDPALKVRIPFDLSACPGVICAGAILRLSEGNSR